MKEMQLKKVDPSLQELVLEETTNLTPMSLQELRKKKECVAKLSRTFHDSWLSGYAFGSAISAELVVYVNKEPDHKYAYCEYLKLTYIGGAYTFRSASHNSNSANFRELGKLLDGGYYAELDEVEQLRKSGFRLEFNDLGEPELFKEEEL